MPKDKALSLPEELSHLTVRDTLFLIRALGENRHEEENHATGFVDPGGIPDVQRHDDRIDYAESIDKIRGQLIFNIDFDDYDFTAVIEKGKIDPAVALEEMQLLVDFANLPPAPTVFTPEEEADRFLAFTSFDDILS